MKLNRVALAMFVVVLVFYLLNLGQSLLLPLVIAGAIAYLINILAHAFGVVSFKGLHLAEVTRHAVGGRGDTGFHQSRDSVDHR
jgi:fatty-acid desaturase